MSGKYNLGKSTAPQEFPAKVQEEPIKRNTIKSAEEFKQLFENKSQNSEPRPVRQQQQQQL